jgi:hypothetical protein
LCGHTSGGDGVVGEAFPRALLVGVLRGVLLFIPLFLFFLMGGTAMPLFSSNGGVSNRSLVWVFLPTSFVIVFLLLDML